MTRTPLWRRYARLFGPDPVADVDEELRFHIESKIEDLIGRGLTPRAARFEAKRQFGDLNAVQRAGEQLSRRRERKRVRGDYFGSCVQDLRYALHTLLRDRSFAVVTVLILALGIAANTAVFSVVNTVMLRPLPFPDAQQLTWLTSGRALNASMRESAGLSAVTYSVEAYEELQRENHSFQALTSYNPFLGNSEYTLTGQGEPQAVAGVLVAGNFFQTLGVQPVLGRLFSREEIHKGGRAAVLLSYAFWKRQFAGDTTIAGRTVQLSKQSMTVVGVLPPTFDFGSVFSPGLSIQVYVPAIMDDPNGIRNWGNTLALVGRLKPGVSLAQAQAEADVLTPRLKAEQGFEGLYTSTITGLKESVSGKLHRSLIVLWCAVGLILLIVCLNLSNLLLARAAARSKEFAMRSALGADRGRLFRQLLTESLVLSFGGAALGLGLAYGFTFYLAHQGSIALPLLSSVRVDGAALTWTLLLTVAAGVFFGLAPGLKITSGNLQDVLKNTGHGLSAGRKYEKMRAAVVISEVALACVLLIGAGLLLRSFLKVVDSELGFKPSQADVMKIDYDDGGKRERRGPVLQEILRNVNAISGVEAAGIADMLPLGRNRSWGFAIKGKTYRKGEISAALVRIVTPGYLDALGIRLRQGRDFTWHDTAKSKRIMIVNQAFARRFWPGEDGIGRIVNLDGETQVVGIISDVRVQSVESSSEPEMYMPMTQNDPEGAELVVRSKISPAALAPTILATLRWLNPAQPASEFLPLQQIVDHAVSPRRFFVSMVGAFALFGLILASLGIYGVISYSVAGRTQEIGIRMALGATASQVQAGVVSKAFRLALAGVTLGSLGAFVEARSISALLFGTSPTDPLTFAGIVLLLVGVALVAGYIPARRASHISPMIALRGN